MFQEESSSFSNADEAAAIVNLILNLVQTKQVALNNIGVIAPFRKQVVLLRQLLREQYLGSVQVTHKHTH